MRASFLSRTLVFWIVATCLVIISILFRVGHTSKKVQAQYTAYAESELNRHKMKKVGQLREYSKQQRYGVSKRVWLSEKNPRLALELEGARSELSLVTLKNQASLSETFYDASGIVQEELFYVDEEGREYILEGNDLKRKGQADLASYVTKNDLKPMQHFRYFEADRAVYDYSTNTLVGYGVTFWTYTAPGHDLIKDVAKLRPELSGEAKAMTMFHEGKVGTIQFAAEDLKMQLNPSQ
jgi:hypothetical protein